MAGNAFKGTMTTGAPGSENILSGLHGYYDSIEHLTNSKEFKKLPSFARESFLTAWKNNANITQVSNELDDLTKAAKEALAAQQKAIEDAERARVDAENRRLAKQELDERLAQEHAANIKRELIGQSEEFERNKAGLGQRMAALAGEDTRLQLGEQLKDVEQAANRRGLLYSGMKERALGQTRGAASADLMAKQQAINEDIQAQSDAYKQLASQGVRQNEGQIFANMGQRQANALNSYQQGLQARRAKLAGNQNTRGLTENAFKLNQGYKNFMEGEPDTGYYPAAFQAGGQILGAGISAYNNRDKGKTTT